MDNFNILLSQALLRVGCLEGVVSEHEQDDIAIKGGHFDDYLLVTYLGQLLESGEMEVKISPSRLNYMRKLLHIKK